MGDLLEASGGLDASFQVERRLGIAEPRPAGLEASGGRAASGDSRQLRSSIRVPRGVAECDSALFSFTTSGTRFK